MNIGPPPARPIPAEPPSVPWLPAVLPVILSVVMALVFRSPLALMMGVLGPLMVMGSWWEGIKRHQSSADLVEAEYDQSLSEYRENLVRMREETKTQALDVMPRLDHVFADPLGLGLPPRQSMIRVGTHWWTPPSSHPLAGTGGIAGMPFGVEAGASLAFVGSEKEADVWRAIVVSWCLANSGVLEPRVGSADFPVHGPFPTRIVGKSLALWVSDITEVAADISTVVVARGYTRATVITSQGLREEIVTEGVSLAQARWMLDRIGSRAPERQRAPEVDYTARDCLWWATRSEEPPINLVVEGPHAVVWGATGSGKSVTVSALIHSMAAHYSPRDLVVVLIDFKGGAGLATLAGLPHTVGVVTDLDQSRVDRALAGIHAEMLKREQLLATHGVTECAQLPPECECPRLVIVIDEAAWLLTTFPSFGQALSDVLARGRSLGIHVIMSTQRITGVLTPAMMANISLRICARVSDASECASWMPELSPEQQTRSRHLEPGSIFISGATRPVREYRVDAVTPRDYSAIPSSPWRVWAEALPERVAADSACWALADDPERQRHRSLGFDQLQHGSVLILGDPRCGKTTAAHTIASGFSTALLAPSDPFRVWQCLTSANAQSLVVLDDFDSCLNASGHEGAALLVECVETFAGRLVMTSSGSTRHARALSRLAEHLVVMSLAKPDVAVAWDGGGVLPPGRARWGDSQIQIASDARAPRRWAPPESTPAPAPPLVLTRDESVWEGSETKFVGTPETWAMKGLEIASVLARHRVIITELSPGEIRYATAGRIVLPPLPIPPDQWVVWDQGTVSLVSAERFLP